MRSKTKQGNYILDNIDGEVIVDYCLTNFYEYVKDAVMENEGN